MVAGGRFRRGSVAAPVHPAKALHHALPCDQIAGHVLGVEIDADFGG